MDLKTYFEYLQRQPVSDHTRRNYLLRVRQFLDWVADSVDGSKALENAIDRDFAVRDYKVYLLQSGSKPATVNAALVAIDNFYLFAGIGASKVKRHDLPAAAPRALNADEMRRLLKAIAHCESSRNKTIALMMLHTGLRISELANLNYGDVFLTARKGEIAVRCGKGSKQRIVPMNSDLREVMQIFLSGPRDPAEPLFKSRVGKRISTSAIDYLIRQLARDAGVEMSAHTLRHYSEYKIMPSRFQKFCRSRIHRDANVAA